MYILSVAMIFFKVNIYCNQNILVFIFATFIMPTICLLSLNLFLLTCMNYSYDSIIKWCLYNKLCSCYHPMTVFMKCILKIVHSWCYYWCFRTIVLSCELLIQKDLCKHVLLFQNSSCQRWEDSISVIYWKYKGWFCRKISSKNKFLYLFFFSWFFKKKLKATD